MNLSCNLLLITHVTICWGRFTVDSRTKSTSLNIRTSTLPFLSAFCFWPPIASTIESYTYLMTVSQYVTPSICWISSLAVVRCQFPIAILSAALVSAFLELLGMIANCSVSWLERGSLLFFSFSLPESTWSTPASYVMTSPLVLMSESRVGARFKKYFPPP